ncbi:MAG: putative transcriptional regulator, partial [Natronomonas sp.]
MAKETDPREFGVLRSKRAATRYQILVEIAERQPAVNQQEIA